MLVVDDRDDRRERIIRAATYVGFKRSSVFGAGSFDEAVDLIERTDLSIGLAVIDVVLTELPAKEGLELMALLRSKHPDCKIIALTSQGGTEFGVEALHAGADDFISTKWEYVNWYRLLQDRLKLWMGKVGGLASTN
jgi:DNA-binding response OmpR family regulator